MRLQDMKAIDLGQFDAPVDLWAPQTILGTQWNSTPAVSGAKKLTLAVFVEGITGLTKVFPHRRNLTVREKRLFREDLGWVLSRSRKAFGFEWCCYHLRYDPGYIRAQLARAFQVDLNVLYREEEEGEHEKTATQAA